METLLFFLFPGLRLYSETKNQPKEEVFGRTSLRTSGQKLRSGPPNAGKTSILQWICRADVHEKTSVWKTSGWFFVPYVWCIPFFLDLWCIRFSQADGIHHSLFLLCDLGVGWQTEKRGVPRWWCILFLSWQSQHSGKAPPKRQKMLPQIFGIVQKVFSEKASAIARMRQKCVRNASEMRHKCVKMGLVLLGKEERPKCVRNPSKLRPKCVKNARNTFGGEHLLDDTEICLPPRSQTIIRCAKGIFAKVQGFPFSGGKAPRNSVTQVSASLRAGGLYSGDALWLAKGEFRGAFPPEKGNPCTFQNPPSENPLHATNQTTISTWWHTSWCLDWPFEAKTYPMCFLTVSSRPCLETSPHSYSLDTV